MTARDVAHTEGAGRANTSRAHYVPRSQRRDRWPDYRADQQSEIIHMAFQVLGRDAATRFLNCENAQLGGVPLTLVIDGQDGSARVKAELRSLQKDREEKDV